MYVSFRTSVKPLQGKTGHYYCFIFHDGVIYINEAEWKNKKDGFSTQLLFLTHLVICASPQKTPFKIFFSRCMSIIITRFACNATKGDPG